MTDGKRPRSAADDALDAIDAVLDAKPPNPFPFEDEIPAPATTRGYGHCYRCGAEANTEDVCGPCRAYVLGDSDHDPAEAVRAAEAERVAQAHRNYLAGMAPVWAQARPCAAEPCDRHVVSGGEPALCDRHRLCDVAGCHTRAWPDARFCPIHRPSPRPQPPDVEEPWSWRYDMPRACHELRYLSMTVASVSDELLEDSAAVGVLLDRLRVPRPRD